MRLLLIFFLFVLSLNVMASEVVATMSADGKMLSVRGEGIDYKVSLTPPVDVELDGKPQFYGSASYSIIYVPYADFESATTVAYAVNSKGEKLWSMNLGAFNPSPPLIEKDFVYLSAIGRVWKLEKNKGKVIWQHQGLYENKKYEFNGAEAVSRKGDDIVFAKNLQVNDKTGKIVEVNK